MGGAATALPIVTISEAQAYLRIETGEEEALLAGLIRTASGLCEAFINRVVIAREFALDVPASGAWERLPVAPVRSIGEVDAVDVSGVVLPLPSDAYAVDIDCAGDGWVRVNSSGASRVGSAGPRAWPTMRTAFRSRSGKACCGSPRICSRRAMATAANRRPRSPRCGGRIAA